MAYQSNNLSVLAYANGFTLWHYASTEDTAAEILADGHLNDASGMLRTGDMIVVGGTDNGAIARVSGNAGGVVTLGTFFGQGN